jgi:hypothetical protein
LQELERMHEQLETARSIASEEAERVRQLEDELLEELHKAKEYDELWSSHAGELESIIHRQAEQLMHMIALAGSRDVEDDVEVDDLEVEGEGEVEEKLYNYEGKSSGGVGVAETSVIERDEVEEGTKKEDTNYYKKQKEESKGEDEDDIWKKVAGRRKLSVDEVMADVAKAEMMAAALRRASLASKSESEVEEVEEASDVRDDKDRDGIFFDGIISSKKKNEEGKCDKVEEEVTSGSISHGSNISSRKSSDSGDNISDPSPESKEQPQLHQQSTSSMTAGSVVAILQQKRDEDRIALEMEIIGRRKRGTEIEQWLSPRRSTSTGVVARSMSPRNVVDATTATPSSQETIGSSLTSTAIDDDNDSDDRNDFEGINLE